MQLPGTLSTYNPHTRLTMFESGPQNSRGSVVFVAGLMDGYNALPYLPLLGKYLGEHLGFSLIQVMLTSSHMGYGVSSLLEDVRELDILLTFLREERAKTRLFFIGHSTGCQDAISFASHGRNRAAVQGIVLQGPVSDREFMMASLNEMYGKYVRLAQRMINDGKGQELMVREVDVAPVSAYRFNSLASIGGDDDMFSSDIPFESLQALFGQVKTPLIMVHSGKDEYIPPHINKESLVSNLTKASPSSLGAVVLPDADHAISDLASQTIFCDTVVQFIRKVLYTLDQEEKAQEQALGGLSL
ncbi:hypothetical protein EC957_005415 [Mortierella hygrophila]|uniref:DUF1749-domain-containing protein n=1 Tax=Mortierella hygrophila TaxID=979708 RepID=A0A9P6F0B0_9FUNG|nr:hypothetical protein EC957_005415 [Mortierella hygrophila]